MDTLTACASGTPPTVRRGLFLVEAALVESIPGLLASWEEWRRRCPDLEGMQPAEYRLLPHVWRRVEKAGFADRDAGRLRGLLKKAWFHNHHLLQEAGRLQDELEARGIPSPLGRECGLVAANFEEFGDCSTIAVDLLVSARDQHDASRIVRQRRPSMWFDGGRVTFRGEGLAPAHLHVVDESSFARGERVAHAARFLEVADPATLLFAHLLDLFERAPARDLSAACWVIDLTMVLVARPQVEEALLGRIRAEGKVALFRHHFAAAEESLPRVAPAFVRRVAALEPPPAEGRVAAALTAFADAAFVADPVVGEAAWWMAQRGADPRSTSPCMTARYLKNRATDLGRNAIVDPRSLVRVIRAPRHYLRSALALFRRKPDGTHQA